MVALRRWDGGDTEGGGPGQQVWVTQEQVNHCLAIPTCPKTGGLSRTVPFYSTVADAQPGGVAEVQHESSVPVVQGVDG